MSSTVLSPDELPRVDHLVTEDDKAVDNLPSEKQQRLLTEPLYSSWAGPGEGRPFLVAANVGIFPSVHRPPIVPDVFLSLDVEVAEDWWKKEHRSYFAWEFGKVPEVVIEVVSNDEGGEAGRKLREVAQMRVAYYAIFDPLRRVQAEPLVVLTLRGGAYERNADTWIEEVGLGLTLWEGTFERKHDRWLRWCDRSGRVVPTGAERADEERSRADEERSRADEERSRAEEATRRAEEATRRAEGLDARLRSLGVDPNAT